ncbi:MAG: substrate-binding domain-containing protein [Spirochaetaceae bacterium]
MKKTNMLFIIIITIIVVGIIFLFSFNVIQFKPKNNSNYIVFLGGSEESRFSKRIENGVIFAAESLDVNIELVWSNWEPNKMLIQFKESINKNPDGIAIMGHPGTGAFKTLIDEAIRKGIIVTSMNVPLPEIQRTYKNHGFGYAGEDLYQSGHNLARAAIVQFELIPGDEIIFFSTSISGMRENRSLAAIAVFNEYGLKIINQKKILFDDKEEAIQWQANHLRELMSEHPEAKLVFDDINISATVQGLKDAGVGPDYIHVVGFGLSPSLMTELKTGYIDLLSDQQPFLQGYLSVLQLVISDRWSFAGLDINTGSAIQSRNTIIEIEEYVEQGLR